MSDKEAQLKPFAEKPSYHEIPPYLEKMLMDFTANVLETSPEDLIDYAAEYFQRLEDQMNAGKPEEVADSTEQKDINKNLGSRNSRRSSVAAEPYDPELEKADETTKSYPKSEDELTRIKDRIKDIFLFRDLQEAEMKVVLNVMVPREVRKGEVIIRQGEDGDFFYVVDKGSYDVYVTDKDVKNRYVMTYDNCGSFGELALLHNQPRAATVKAMTDGFLWAVSRKTFRRLLANRYHKKRQRYLELITLVKELESLSDYERLKVCDSLSERVAKEGEVVFWEGSEADGMYFVEEGAVEVTQTSAANPMEEEYLATLYKGDFFGEMALVMDQPRSATVTAIQDSKFAFMDIKAFERLLGPCIEIMQRHIATYDDPPEALLLGQISEEAEVAKTPSQKDLFERRKTQALMDLKGSLDKSRSDVTMPKSNEEQTNVTGEESEAENTKSEGSQPMPKVQDTSEPDSAITTTEEMKDEPKADQTKSKENETMIEVQDIAKPGEIKDESKPEETKSEESGTIKALDVPEPDSGAAEEVTDKFKAEKNKSVIKTLDLPEPDSEVATTEEIIEIAVKKANIGIRISSSTKIMPQKSSAALKASSETMKNNKEEEVKTAKNSPEETSEEESKATITGLKDKKWAKVKEKVITDEPLPQKRSLSKSESKSKIGPLENENEKTRGFQDKKWTKVKEKVITAPPLPDKKKSDDSSEKEVAEKDLPKNTIVTKPEKKLSTEIATKTEPNQVVGNKEAPKVANFAMAPRTISLTDTTAATTSVNESSKISVDVIPPDASAISTPVIPLENIQEDEKKTQ